MRLPLRSQIFFSSVFASLFFMLPKLLVSLIELFLGVVRVATQKLHQPCFGLFLPASEALRDPAKPFDQDRAELLDVTDLFFKLVRFLFAANVLRKSLTRLNQRETDFLDQLIGAVDRFFRRILELDERRNHADRDDVGSLWKRVLGLSQSVGPPIHRLDRVNDRAGGFIELKRNAIRETQNLDR